MVHRVDNSQYERSHDDSCFGCNTFRGTVRVTRAAATFLEPSEGNGPRVADATKANGARNMVQDVREGMSRLDQRFASLESTVHGLNRKVDTVVGLICLGWGGGLQGFLFVSKRNSVWLYSWCGSSFV